jgi:hypothetical protein
MADIRQSTTAKDDFNRADEDPLSGGGNWAQTDSGVFTPMVIKSNAATHQSGGPSSMSHWTPTTYDGDAAEAWGARTGGGAGGIAWGIGLARDVGGSNAMDGYRFRDEDGSTSLKRFLNGSDSTVLDTGTGTSGADGDLLLIRRNGNDVEGWFSSDDGANWTLKVSATDTTYTTGFYLALSIRDNSASQLLGWDYFGGGPAKPFIPQIYRRR